MGFLLGYMTIPTDQELFELYLRATGYPRTAEIRKDVEGIRLESGYKSAIVIDACTLALFSCCLAPVIGTQTNEAGMWGCFAVTGIALIMPYIALLRASPLGLATITDYAVRRSEVLAKHKPPTRSELDLYSIEVIGPVVAYLAGPTLNESRTLISRIDRELADIRARIKYLDSALKDMVNLESQSQSLDPVANLTRIQVDTARATMVQLVKQETAMVSAREAASSAPAELNLLVERIKTLRALSQATREAMLAMAHPADEGPVRDEIAAVLHSVEASKRRMTEATVVLESYELAKKELGTKLDS